MSSWRDRYISNAALLKKAQSDTFQLDRFYRCGGPGTVRDGYVV